MTSLPPPQAITLRATGWRGSERLVLTLIASFYGTVLLVNYLALTAPKWAYLGFIRRVPTGVDIALSSVAALLVLPLLPRDVHRPSHVAAWVLYIVVCLPVAVIGPFAYPDDVTMAAPVTWQIAVSLAIFCAIATGRDKSRRLDILPRLAPTSYLLLVLGLLVVASVVTGLGYGFELRPSVVADNALVREIRMAGRAADFPLAGYARNFLGKVLAPAALVLAYVEYRRRRVRLLAWGAAGVAVVGQTLAFSAAANVSLLLAPLAVIALIVVQRRPADVGGRTLLLGSGALVVAAGTLAGSGWWPLQDDFVRRAFQTPATLTVRYFDFFDRNPAAYFEGSLLGKALDAGYYGEAIPRLVGIEYGLPAGTHANANVFADAFGQLGVIGPPLIAVVLAVLFRFIDAVAPARPALVAALLLMPAWSMAESGFASAVLSHGLFLTFLLLAVAPETDTGPLIRARER